LRSYFIWLSSDPVARLSGRSRPTSTRSSMRAARASTNLAKLIAAPASTTSEPFRPQQLPPWDAQTRCLLLGAFVLSVLDDAFVFIPVRPSAYHKCIAECREVLRFTPYCEAPYTLLSLAHEELGKCAFSTRIGPAACSRLRAAVNWPQSLHSYAANSTKVKATGSSPCQTVSPLMSSFALRALAAFSELDVCSSGPTSYIALWSVSKQPCGGGSVTGSTTGVSRAHTWKLAMAFWLLVALASFYLSGLPTFQCVCSCCVCAVA
jgi:hypothetical protein